MVSLTLIGKPKSLHIPAMAMQLASSKESGWDYPTKKCESMDSLIGGNASRWIREKHKTHDIRRIVTRNYIPLQTAFYANWLVFLEDQVAEDFLKSFPQYKIDQLSNKLRAELHSLEQKLSTKLQRGAYDLSRYPIHQRRMAADRYIALDDERRDITERLELLENAKALQRQWEPLIERQISRTEAATGPQAVIDEGP